MLEEGVDLATFLHKSIVEYYAAAFIAHSADDVARLFYDHALKNYRPWEAVIVFLRDVDQYRFAKEYTMQEAPELLSSVTKVLESQNLPNLLKFIESHQPGIGVAVRNELAASDNGMDTIIRAYGPMTDPISLSHEKIPHYLIRAMDACLPRDIGEKDVLAILRSVREARSLTGAKDEVLVTHDVLAQHYGPGEFFNALGQFAGELQATIIKANAIIEAQERRKLIFEDRKGLSGPKAGA